MEILSVETTYFYCDKRTLILFYKIQLYFYTLHTWLEANDILSNSIVLK